MKARDIFKMTIDEIYNYFSPLVQLEPDRYKNKVYRTNKEENIFGLYPYDKPSHKTGRHVYKFPIIDITWNADRLDITVELQYRGEVVRMGITDDAYKRIYYIDTSWEGGKDYD